MRSLLLISFSCLMLGCASHKGVNTPLGLTVDDAIQAVAQLQVGMSDEDALEVIAKHGIYPSGAGGGSVAWSAVAVLSDRAQLVLDFRYESKALRDKDPSKLTGWRVLDPSGRLLPKFSLYETPSPPRDKEGAP